MSSANETVEGPSVPVTPPNRRRGGGVWVWTLIACILLGASGVVRATQERRHSTEKAYKEACPINLSDLPDKFGEDDEWKLIGGGERKLDDLTMRITGGSDHVIKTYANELTGVFVTVLVLFGPAEPVLPHTPQVCYPSSGFELGEYPSMRTIEYSLGNDDQGRPVKGRADFLSASYTKANGRQPIREGVYHSFRLDGLWSAGIGMGRKFPRRNPGIFKVQIQRMVGEGERITAGDPIEQFLEPFLAVLEAKIRAAKNTPAKTNAAG